MTEADIKIGTYQDAIDIAKAAGPQTGAVVARLEDRIEEVMDREMACDTCGRAGGHGSTGLSRCPFESGTAHAVKQDTILGGFWAENAWKEPRYFESQREYEKALDASGLMLKPKASKSSRTIDRTTLENAKALVARIGSVASESEARVETLRVTTRTLPTGFTVRAEA